MGVQELIGNAFKKVFGSRNDRLLKKIAGFADEVEAWSRR